MLSFRQVKCNTGPATEIVKELLISSTIEYPYYHKARIQLQINPFKRNDP